MSQTKNIKLDDTSLLLHEGDGIASLVLVPESKVREVVCEKLEQNIFKNQFNDVRRENCIQLALEGDQLYAAFTNGLSYKYAETSFRLKKLTDTVKNSDGLICVSIEFSDGNLTAIQHLDYHKTSGVIECYTELINAGDMVTVHSLPSVNLSNLSPFVGENDYTSLIVHEVLSNWSAEGRRRTNSLSKLNMEDSWAKFGAKVLKYGQVGNMPARGNYPYLVLEDVSNKVAWGIVPEAIDSWQIELMVNNGTVSISAGMPDYAFGHNYVTLNHGDRFVTPKVLVTVSDSVYSVESRFKRFIIEDYLTDKHDFNVLFNEYCYTWGNPKEEILKPLVIVAGRLNAKYFVVDAGWYKNTQPNWEESLGDWNESKELFPMGVSSFVNFVHKHGMECGVWYELENACVNSNVAREHPDWLLTSGGKIIVNRDRVFLDFRKEEVRAYLKSKVNDYLKTNGLTYTKVDYNACPGIGVDGIGCKNRNLSDHMNEVYRFLSEIKSECDGLKLELCSSGGFRNTYAYMKIADMVSVTDIHFSDDIAYTANNMARIIPPQQLQLWCTLDNKRTDDELIFYMCVAMLGRLCFSGNIFALSEEKTSILDKGVAYYTDLAPINGRSDIVYSYVPEDYTSLRPEGELYTVKSFDGGMLVYLYCFGPKDTITVDYDFTGYEVKDSFGNMPFTLEGGRLVARAESDHNATVFRLIEQ